MVRRIIVCSYGRVSSGTQRRRERLRDPSFQSIAGNSLHLLLDRVEALALTLPDLDGEELQQMAIPVGGAGAGPVGPVQKPACNVESNGSSRRRCPSRSVSRPDAGSVD